MNQPKPSPRPPVELASQRLAGEGDEQHLPTPVWPLRMRASLGFWLALIVGLSLPTLFERPSTLVLALAVLPTFLGAFATRVSFEALGERALHAGRGALLAAAMICAAI